MKHKLSPDQLTVIQDTGFIKNFKFTPTGVIKSMAGQDRAVKALHLGLKMRAEGFNIYVSGESGTGRMTAVKNFVEELAAREPNPGDWCYVYNFCDPYQPVRIKMPPGKACELKKDMKDLVADVIQALIRVFESEEYASQRQKIVDVFKAKQEEVFDSINEIADKESFSIKQTPWEITAIPVLDGEPVTDEKFNALPAGQQEKFRKTQDKLVELIKTKLRELNKQEKEVNKNLGKLEKEVAGNTIADIIDDIEEKYKDLAGVTSYLADVKQDILENLGELFASRKVRGQEAQAPGGQFLKRYEVNILVDNCNMKGAPVVIERNPSYGNLIGKVEKESYMGTLYTDFTMIRKGALHSANGGYLIIRVDELLQNYFSWQALKRAIKHREVVIEEPGEQYGLMSTRTLKPDPVPIDVKVILIGLPVYYRLLYALEPDFATLFKVKADFDNEMPRNTASMTDYLQIVMNTCAEEHLLMTDHEALAGITEYGSRLTGDQEKLSTRFEDITDVVREANHYAVSENANGITGRHVTRAIEEKCYRSNLVQEKITGMISRGELLIDVAGTKTGQVNGLAVIDLGDIAFGRPNRITCSVGLGKEGIIAIEREAELSGPIHTKGVMILTGYITDTYLRQQPVSLAARLVFEQSYSEVEGDSASSAELYALLSALSGVPVRQGIAVTGSVNQKGEVQAIGGVNEKVEGFFEICKKAGLNGQQGVIIPASNRKHLLLKEEVIEAVKSEKFSIWTVDHIDEGIELLTGVPGGPADKVGTIAYKVQEALNEYADRAREYLKTENGKKKSGKRK